MERGGKNLKSTLIGLVLTPGEQFERIKVHPIIWRTMGIITLMYVLGMWMKSIGIETPGLGGLNTEEITRIERFTSITMIVSGLFLPFFTVLISSVFLMSIVKIAGSKVTFKQLFSMNTYIMFIRAIGVVLNGIIFALIGGSAEMMYTSLGSFIDTRGAVSGLLERIEVFAIWSVILSAVGMQKVANLSKGLAWTIAILIFAIGVLFAMLGAIASGKVGA
ncbi:YIP1 family protein [Oceanobacillus caeni]|uniref:YIP1 family protein n=1 Tax=Oceanobacillus caeni TaxID=405946 RepID=UPI002E21B975|nr:YIP1 family protein [Oceanobacillus caeni]